MYTPQHPLSVKERRTHKEEDSIVDVKFYGLHGIEEWIGLGIFG
jgi:hypothetical protein